MLQAARSVVGFQLCFDTEAHTWRIGKRTNPHPTHCFVAPGFILCRLLDTETLCHIVASLHCFVELVLREAEVGRQTQIIGELLA